MTAATVNAPRMTPALLAGLQAAAYIRVSSDEQARPDRFGPSLQRSTIAQFADRLGVQLIAEYQDLGVSGTKPVSERPGLSAALDAIDAGTVEILIAAAPDRLARKTLIALQTEEAIQEAGGIVLYGNGAIDPEALLRWISARAVDDDTQTTREINHVMSSAEKRRIASRLRGARAMKALSGGFAQGRVPYGYTSDDGKLKPSYPAPTPPAVDETAEQKKAREAADKKAQKESPAGTVRRMFELAAGGASPGDIARHLTGTPTPQGGKSWSRQALTKIIRNPTYHGSVHVRVRDEETPWGPERTITVKAQHEPIVSRRLWNTANAELDKRKKK